MISKLVEKYEKHQERKLFTISMAATIAEANLLKAMKIDDTAEKDKFLSVALDDLRLIKNDLAKNDFNGGNENE